MTLKKDAPRDRDAARSPHARAVIVEDEREALVSLRESLARVSWLEVVAEAQDGRKAIDLIDRLRPDLVFLDVQLPELNGLEVLKRIAHAPEVIFTTAYDQHALTAFELGALDYLVKPFGRERLLKTLERARRFLAAGAGAPASRGAASAAGAASEAAGVPQTVASKSGASAPRPPKGSASAGEATDGEASAGESAEGESLKASSAAGEAVAGEAASGVASTEEAWSPSEWRPSEAWEAGQAAPGAPSSTDRVRAVFGTAPLERLFARKHDRIFPIAVRDIQRIQALGDYAEVHAATGVFLLHVSLTELEARLDPGRFLRVHRSHIVSLDAIRHLQTYDERRLVVVLADGSEVIASRKASEKIRGLTR